jgi:hypothetical protein
MRAIAGGLAVLAVAFATPAAAQDPAEEIARLRAELEAAQATIRRVEERLTSLEGASPSTATTSPEGPARGIPTVDLTVPGGAAAGGRQLPDQALPRMWTVAPPGPLGRTALAPPVGNTAAVELLGGTGGGRASFSLTRSADRDAGPANGDFAIAINDTFSLTFSAPLAKGEDDTSFATLDGLSTGTKLELEYTQFRGPIRTQAADARDQLLERARQRCRDARPAYEPGCVRLDEPFMARFFEGDERDRYERGYARETLQGSFAWSLRAALGYDEFSYYPLPTLTKTTDERVSWSLGAGITFFPIDRASASLDLDYARSFKGRTAVTTCPVPAAGAATVSCVPGPLEGPEQIETLTLAPEFRYILPVSSTGLIRRIGLAPRAEFDILSNEFAIDVPIYLVSSEGGGLVGGPRFGYVSKDDEFIFGIFLGTSFSLFR